MSPERKYFHGMDFWNPLRSPARAPAIHLFHFRVKVAGTKALKLERWLTAARQGLRSYETADYTGYRNPKPAQLEAERVRGEIGIIELELRWRRQGHDGPFR